MVLQRLVVVVAVLAAGCAASGPPASPPAVVGDDRTDVWFAQHMVPHLRQTTSIVLLNRDRIASPGLARLADATAGQDRADVQRLEGWLDRRGLAPHGHSHQRVDRYRQGDLERLSELGGAALDRTFLRVMTARHRAAMRMAEVERRQGTLPEVRRIAGRLLARQRARLRQLAAWERARSVRA